MTDAERWNARYAAAEPTPGEPAAVLLHAERWLPEGGQSLDLACGRGANALWLAARGFDVQAWDVSSEAIEGLRQQPGASGIRCEVRDVVTYPPPAARFDVIVVSRFLERALVPALQSALKPAGVLCYQSFTQGLSNPDYRLAPNELLRLFPALEIRWYHEPVAPALPDALAVRTAAAPRIEAMLVAQRAVAVPADSP